MKLKVDDIPVGVAFIQGDLLMNPLIVLVQEVFECVGRLIASEVEVMLEVHILLIYAVIVQTSHFQSYYSLMYHGVTLNRQNLCKPSVQRCRK